MADRIKVLFLSSWFPTRIIPTLGNFIQRHAEAAALFCDVTVLIIQKDEKIRTFEIEDVSENGVRIIRVYYPGSIYPFQKVRALKKGIRILNPSGRPDFHIVHLNVIWKEGWQALYFKRKFRIPFVITEHWTGYHADTRGPISSRIKKYIRHIARQAELILPVTEHLKKAMEKLEIKTPFRVVSNVVDTELFEPGQSNTEQIRFLHVSHLDDDHKNISGILETWKKAVQIKQNIHLEIGGDGDTVFLRNRIETLGIPPETIQVFDTLSPAEVAQKMRHSDALVLFSNYENQPLVILEAMSCGLKVIASDVGGIKELLRSHPAHTLVTARDSGALLDAILRTEKITPVLQEEIRMFAAKNFSREEIGRAIFYAYEEVLKRNSTPDHPLNGRKGGYPISHENQPVNRK